MENNFTTQEIKQQLFKDLKIDVAFPFFPLGKRTGSAACCVVNYFYWLYVYLCNR